MKTMDDLIHHFLEDIFYAERAAIKNATKLAKAVQNEELKEAILHHREVSQGQVDRLHDIFRAFGKRARGKPCEAMDGLIKECDEAIEEGGKGPVLDSALLACAQAIEHYEIARYGALAAWAESEENPAATELLQETLAEEKEADQILNKIALTLLNPQAAEEGKDEESDGGGEKEVYGGEPKDPVPEAEEEPAPKPKSRAKAKPKPDPAPEPDAKPKRAAKPKAKGKAKS